MNDERCFNLKANGWTALAVTGSTVLDSVTHGSTGSTSDYWQLAQSGRTFELRAAGFNNNYGANWRVSCNDNVDGTPGSAPSDCVSTEDSCSALDGCTTNGGDGVCASTVEYRYCECTTGYMGDGDTCIASLVSMRMLYASTNLIFVCIQCRSHRPPAAWRM